MIKLSKETVKILLRSLMIGEIVPACIGYSMTVFCNRTILPNSIKVQELAFNTFIKGKTQYHPMEMTTYT